MEMISGFSGSSENSARQASAFSSGQMTISEPPADSTVTGPGRTPERSTGTVAALQNRGNKKTVSRMTRL